MNFLSRITIILTMTIVLIIISCKKDQTGPDAKAVQVISDTPSFVEDFNDPDWETNNGITVWHQASWMQNGTQMSVDRCQVIDGKLTLTVLPGEPYQGGSIQTRKDDWGYGRWEARLKPSDEPGALNSMFTMDWNGKTYEEVDIEFLTYTFGDEWGEVHFALHEEGQTNYWWQDVPLDFNPSDGFHTWAIQILPDSVSWYADQQRIRTVVYTDQFRLTSPYQFFFNAWTKETWIHGPPADTAIYQIDWVKFYPAIEN